MLLFERDPVPGDYGLIECEPRFRTVPFDEFSDRVVVCSLRARGSQAVQNGDFDCSRSGSLRTDFGARLRFILLFAIGTASIAVANSMIQLSISYTTAFIRTDPLNEVQPVLNDQLGLKTRVEIRSPDRE